jgi:hypothetical protein
MKTSDSLPTPLDNKPATKLTELGRKPAGKREVKFLALLLLGIGILSFVVGDLLGGPDGGIGIYFGEVGLLLIAIGFGVWFFMSL